MTGRLDWLPQVLRAAGLTVVEHDGWGTRGSADFTPTWQIFHHTASSRRGGAAPSLGTVIHGRPDVPGPLCNVLVGRDGTMHIIAAGRANHAGRGHYPDGTTGNRLSVGWECENDGIGEPWPEHQLDAIARGMAAVGARLGLPAGHVIGHKEFAPGRKVDPTGIDMAAWRRRVAAIGTTPAPPAHQEDDDMTPEQAKQLASAETHAAAADLRCQALEQRLATQDAKLERLLAWAKRMEARG